MAWPPPVLPIDITDATEQQTAHPDLHNKTSQAVNDIVPKVQAVISGVNATRVGGGSADIGFGNAGMHDLFVSGVIVFPVPVRVAVVATFQFGFGGAAVNADGQIVRTQDGGSVSMSATSPAGLFANLAVAHYYTAAAGVDAGFKTRINVNNGSYNSCFVVYTIAPANTV